MHVVRHPSWISFKSAHAKVTWHVAYEQKQVSENAEMVSFVFESQHSTSVAPSDSRIFPDCACGNECLHASTWAGPSTGAVVLSKLQQESDIETTDVFGMNWNGDSDAHIDFKNASIVKGCCTKCSFHDTSSDDYGNSAALRPVSYTHLTLPTICSV